MKKHISERFGETIVIMKLTNGMEVHVLPKEAPYYTTYVELSMPYGALHIEYALNDQVKATPPGTAHFLEHQIFAMPDGDAFSKFSMLGTDANAMTSYAQTSYLFVATDNVFEALDHLLNMIDTPYFIKSKVEQEKNIIKEELKMYLDDPVQVMQNTLLEQMYHNHPIKHDIGGTIASVETVDAKLLDETYHAAYGHSNRLLVIAGNTDIERITQYFKTYEKRFNQRTERPKLILPKEPIRIVKRHAEVVSDVKIDRLMLGVKLTPKSMSKEKRLIKEMALSMLLNMMLGASSEAYHQLLEDELINHSFYVSTNVEKGAENIIIYGESNQVDALRSELIKLLTKDIEQRITQAAFERYKKVFLGQFIYALNHLDTKAYLYGKYHHMKTSLYDVVDILRKIDYQDVHDVIVDIKPSRITTLIHRKKIEA